MCHKIKPNQAKSTAYQFSEEENYFIVFLDFHLELTFWVVDLEGVIPL